MAENSSLSPDRNDPRALEWDRRMMAAMHDVPVPSDLEQRLMLRLGLESPPSTLPSLTAQPRQSSLQSRGGRRLFMTLVALSVAAIAAGAYWHSFRPLDEADLLTQAVRWKTLHSGTWRELSTADYSFSNQLRTFPTAVQIITTDLDARTHVFMLDRQPERAYLYVLKPNRAVKLPAGVTRMGGTAGWQYAAWQDRGMLYIVLVNGLQGEPLDRYLPSNEIVRTAVPGSEHVRRI